MERMTSIAVLLSFFAAGSQHAWAVPGPQGSTSCDQDASVETAGQATWGTHGFLRLEMSGSPQQKRPFHLEVAGAPPGAPGVLVFTMSAAPPPLPLAEPQDVIAVHSFVTERNGTSPPLLRYDDVPESLCGLTLVAQARVFDAGAIDGIAFTKTANIRFGGPPVGPLFPGRAYDFGGDPLGNPLSVASADLNGDGILDCVMVGDGIDGPDLAILLGSADGQFTAASALEVGLARGVVVDDFDADRVPDIAFSSDDATPSIEVLQGLGDGSFVPFASTPWIGNEPGSMATGDLDGDGDLDIVVADRGSKLVGSVLSNGDGTFTPLTIATSPGMPTQVALADLNGDLVLDLAVAVEGGPQIVRFGAGDGTFPAGPVVTGSTFASSVAVGDLDGNLVPDLVFGAQVVGVFLGSGGGSFGPASTFSPPIGELGPEEIVDLELTDLEVDGDLDIVATNSNSESIHVFSGQGDGSFVLTRDYLVGTTPVAATVRDFDGDSALDVAVATSDRSLNVFLGKGDGSFLANVDTLISEADGGAECALGDLNGDQEFDLAMKRANANQPLTQPDELVIWKGAGDGTFELHQTISSGGDGGGTVELVDLTGDLAPEVVLINRSPTSTSPFAATLVVFENQGHGTFAQLSVTDFGTTGWDDFVLADLDGDAVVDAVAVRALGFDDDTGEYGVLLGARGGGFRPPIVAPTIGPRDLATGDLDDDHVPDVVIAGTNPDELGTVSVLLGLGDGTFASPLQIDIGALQGGSSSSLTLKIVDLDGDKALDLVLSKGLPSADSLVIVHGNGDGTFDPPLSSGVINGPLVAVRDMNGDERLDVVTRGFEVFSEGPAVSLGRRDGSFAPHLRFHGSADYVADIDGDLLPDLVGLRRFGVESITFMPGLLLR